VEVLQREMDGYPWGFKKAQVHTYYGNPLPSVSYGSKDDKLIKQKLHAVHYIPYTLKQGYVKVKELDQVF